MSKTAEALWQTSMALVLELSGVSIQSLALWASYANMHACTCMCMFLGIQMLFQGGMVSASLKQDLDAPWRVWKGI